VAGLPSDPVTVAAVDRTAPQAPTGIQVVPNDGGAFVQWQENNETDLAGYRVLRAEMREGPFTPVQQAIQSVNAIFDPGYRAGIYYGVIAVDVFGNESERSAAGF
jgi:hypothetical protein